MDVTLRMLGRPDLAKYIERKRKLDISKGQRHSLSKRSLYGNVELSKVVLSKENEKNIKGKENCTNQIHEAHHNASPAEAKVLPNGYNCTCTCSDVDIESGSVNDYPEYHRGRKNDREKSRKPLKKKKKEKTKDGDLLESFIKKSSKAKEQRKKHKYKTKSVRTKDFDRTKSDKKKIRSNLIADFKKYPTCDCCKCTADYK
ncbi:hypothetical protein KPH14_011696 [Odynerus spinipes]|uniref:Uncharacterized protein n=1 Tax=Odynerus spinipes TaxID=1348599 RepID=A0AAD9VTQ5_9HYME|nr:hypothetical protein KPH14_011696 [Odynerus spinipes]